MFHLDYLSHTFVHWKIFLPVAIRRSYAYVSEHNSGLSLFTTLTRHRLEGLLLLQLPDGVISDNKAIYRLFKSYKSFTSIYIAVLIVLLSITFSFPKLSSSLIYVEIMLLSSSLCIFFRKPTNSHG
jgi:hypothetical protein